MINAKRSAVISLLWDRAMNGLMMNLGIYVANDVGLCIGGVATRLMQH